MIGVFIPRVVHFDISADDVERAKEFYEKTFGWEIKKWEGGDEMDYWLVMTGPKDKPGIDGGLAKYDPSMGERAKTFTNTIEVPDIEEYARKINENGGKVSERMNIPNVGMFAECEDTEGNRFGIMEPNPDMQM